MRGHRLRWLVSGLLASGGAGLLTLTAAMNASFAYGSTDTALVMGGTFNPTPDPGYVADVNNNYIQLIPLTEGYSPQGLYTPEQFWPVSGLTSLTFDQSVARGVTDLNNAIVGVCGTDPTCGGNQLAVFGYSQSATIATDEMRALDALPVGVRPDPSQLAFILVGDPNNPDGGILERFVGAYIPLLDVSFNGATPPDTPYPTDIYTIQYDGVPDTPQYPLNLPADLNALLGYFYLHGDYPTVPVSDFNVALPTSPGYDGVTHYYEMLTQNLPLLDPLRSIPVVGNPLADLVQPDFRVIVDLGYGDGYANVPTPADLFGPLVNPLTVGSELLTGAQQGVVASLVDVGLLPSADLPTTYPYLPLAETPGELQLPGILSALSDASGTVSSLLSSPASLPQDLLDLLGGTGLSSLSSDLLGLGSELTSMLQGLDLPSGLLAVPDILGFVLDPSMLLSAFGALGL